ncbi:MAG: hypothetical protein HUJ68_10870 [Clostridia bacterium]|nr:hypothetical protein [Clostridia bacterium]
MEVLFICIGNINRSRSAEAILNALQLENVHAFSRGLLLNTEGRPISPQMYELLSDDEKKFVSEKATPLEIKDLQQADKIIVMDYYVLNFLKQRFSEYYWKDKLRFYTQDETNTEPFKPIKDPYETGDFKTTYLDLKKYMHLNIN